MFDVDGQPHLLLSNGSRIYGITDKFAAQIDDASINGDVSALDRLLSECGLDAPPYIESVPPKGPKVRALSLSIAQKCNLGCTYCYAQGGDFGGPARNMPIEVALKSVDRLLAEAEPGEPVNLVFLGGEPLVNRKGLMAATEYAAEQARAKGVPIRFSITTNGTLLTAEDGAFFERHGFAVNVSLDGIGPAHDRQRSFKSGKGSFEHIISRLRPLLELQRQMQVSARVTVTPGNLDLRRTLDGLIELGFHSVGFSPMLSSPTGLDEMAAADLNAMLEQMVECGRACEQSIAAGKRYPFSNFVTAMREIHKGTHRPYPCGAGAGYFGVSADGGMFACHRFVDDKNARLGDIETGVDVSGQSEWLAARHVHFQEPCSRCWARYLCGGGCHHEVIHRGRPACDYIRGWLHYCLQAYVRLLQCRPDFFLKPAASKYSPAAPKRELLPIQ